MSPLRLVLVMLALLVLAAALYVGGVRLGLYGRHRGAGVPTATQTPNDVLDARRREEQRAAAALTPVPPAKEILFGDLHVHTTFSTDAFLRSLPMMGGDGAHPVSDACDYARFCSALDFWSINDHAEASTPRKWEETVEAIRACNEVGSDVVPFLGWEWSQVGATPEDHYGHKNVVLRGLSDPEITTRPIGAAGLASDALRARAARIPPLLPLVDFANRQEYFDFIHFLQETRETPSCAEGVDARALPGDCYESAATPRDLFEKLAQWGVESIVIPHGTTWGFYSPMGTSLDKQLVAAQNDPSRQFLFEIMSGHGNSEEYRDWREVDYDTAGNAVCPAPRPDYVPGCFRAGEIIAKRCLDAGLAADECARRAEEASRLYLAAGAGGHGTVPGMEMEEWLDAGQCRDCFLPSFNYRPRGSGQYALALSGFEDPARPARFRFGFIAASDNHSARPGTGYKEIARRHNTEAAGAPDAVWRERLAGEPEVPEPASRPVDLRDPAYQARAVRALEAERQASFFLTGGLAAVHAEGRGRDAIWSALRRKEVYGTSGDRMLLWFHLLNAERPDGSFGSVPMGGEVRTREVPRFEVRAVGAFRQKPGCPEYSVRALSAERLAHLCQGECYHPSDQRKRVTRIEVVRIRPQAVAGEAVAPLIQDPWKTFACEPSQAGCAVQFEDPEFPAAGRDTVYYARAIEESGDAVNAANLRCSYDESGRCVEVRPCYGDYRTPFEDDCLAASEERAWSSPIYVDFDAAGPAAPAGAPPG